MKFRLVFSMADSLRWLSHLDLARAWARVFVRSGLSLQYSEGFSPHQKIAFGPALPVGISGEAEYLDVGLLEAYEVNEVVARLNELTPIGLLMQAGVVLPEGTKHRSLNAVIDTADYRFQVPRRREVELMQGLTGAEIIAKKMSGDHVWLTARVPVGFKALAAASDTKDETRLPWRDARVDRLALWVNVDGQLVSPLSIVDGEPSGG